MKRRFSAGRIFMFVLLGLAAGALFTYVVMLLWNQVLAQVVHVGLINFWQALGLLVLSKILFGGPRGAHWGRHRYWGNKMRQKWMAMSPEEREKFKQEWKNRCGGYYWGETGQFQEQTEPIK
ncbi:MAG: hypothetical protein ACHQEM_11500 [Chitinophagales bacterium]